MLVHRFISLVPGFRPGLAVHVGAHKAGEAGRYEERGFRRVIWIEADDVNAGHAERKLSRRTFGTEHTLVRALITDRDGEEVGLRIASNKGGSSSIFGMTDVARERWPEVRETGEVKMVRSSRLDSLLAGLSVAPEDLDMLVIDIQGAELLALRGAGGYLAGPSLVQVEMSQEPLYAGGAQASEVDDFLTAAGFERLSEIPWHGDVAYVRKGRLRRP